MQSRRGQLHAPNAHVATRGFERVFSILSGMRGSGCTSLLLKVPVNPDLWPPSELCRAHTGISATCWIHWPSMIVVPGHFQLLPPVGSGTFSPRRAHSTSECHTSPALAQCSQNQRIWIHRFQTWWALGVLLSVREVGWFVAVLLMPQLETPQVGFV